MYLLGQQIGSDELVEAMTRKENPFRPQQLGPSELSTALVDAELAKKVGRSNAPVKRTVETAQKAASLMEDLIAKHLTGKSKRNVVKLETWEATYPDAPEDSLWSRIRNAHLSGDGFEALSDIRHYLIVSTDQLTIKQAEPTHAPKRTTKRRTKRAKS